MRRKKIVTHLPLAFMLKSYGPTALFNKALNCLISEPTGPRIFRASPLLAPVVNCPRMSTPPHKVSASSGPQSERVELEQTSETCSVLSLSGDTLFATPRLYPAVRISCEKTQSTAGVFANMTGHLFGCSTSDIFCLCPSHQYSVITVALFLSAG